MPVDDDNLKTLVGLASTRLQAIGAEKEKLHEFLTRCGVIIKQPTEDNPNAFQDVVDRNLGIKIYLL